MNQSNETVPTIAAREASARWEACQDWMEVGGFNIHKYEKNSIERTSYMDEALKIAQLNGEMI